MNIRTYTAADCGKLAQLFYDTVHSVNAKDYNKQQLDAWATGAVDMAEWNRSFLEHYSLVAVEDEVIVGFGDMDYTGYLDRLYVHKDYQGQGIATAVCEELEKRCDEVPIRTHASITAKSFFEHRGYLVVKEQEVERCGVKLKNYVMEKM